MKKVIDLKKKKTRASLSYRYSLLTEPDLLNEYKQVSMNYRTEETDKLDVLLIHRLLKRSFGSPTTITFLDSEEKEIDHRDYMASKAESGEYSIEEDGTIRIKPSEGEVGCNWKYYLSTRLGNVVLVQSEDLHTRYSISLLIQKDKGEHDEKSLNDYRAFVDALLEEAERIGGNLINPEKELFDEFDFQFIALENIFLSNYTSADLMAEYSSPLEEHLTQESLKYDARLAEHRTDPDRMNYISKYLHASGMYRASAILYYFMALEGLINIIYQIFLKTELRENRLNLDTRLDLELKLVSLSSVCNGFVTNPIDPKSELFSSFKKLKNYRNHLFHSRISDTLRHVLISENPFFYSFNVRKDKKLFLPEKHRLESHHVNQVKDIIDGLVKTILDSMDPKIGEKFRDDILSGDAIAYIRDEAGRIHFVQPGLTLQDINQLVARGSE